MPYIDCIMIYCANVFEYIEQAGLSSATAGVEI